MGSLFFSNQAGTVWSHCGATSIASTHGNAVWTAAHCLHSGSGGNAGWFSNHIFIPGYTAGMDPYGWWFGVSLIAPNSFINGGDIHNDMGALIVVPESGTNNLQTAVGSWGYRFDGSTSFTNARSYGYPANGYNRPNSDFNDGEYMMYCEGSILDASPLNPLDNRVKMDCDMGQGSSGGPMAIGVGSTDIRIIGSNSHRDVDNNGNLINNWLYSSNHGGTAASIINAVNNG
ncbi:trypsin-like serine peptidase [Micromonospora sp. LOL_024]|uniref:trypsin-like serine peptidase n=1 Tax=Micromonospora sp. LOL_024 TaxID=3345412 RepID=UPI003A865332